MNLSHSRAHNDGGAFVNYQTLVDEFDDGLSDISVSSDDFRCTEADIRAREAHVERAFAGINSNPLILH